MIYLLSWQGRGWVVYLLLIAAVLAAVGVGSLWDRAGVLAMGIAMITLGIACFILGRKWNGRTAYHRFCGMRVQRWVWVFVPIGCVLAMGGMLEFAL